jgi:predicted metal-binding protein
MPDYSDTKLYACETCVRDLRLSPGQSSRGRQLIHALSELIRQETPAPDFGFRVVSCLNGCLNPCNIALRCRGKYSLRFSRLNPQDAQAVMTFAKLYAASTNGDIPQQQWPQVLLDKITVRIPPYG